MSSCGDIWSLSISLFASLVNVSFVLGLPDRFCCGEILAVRFRLLFFFFSVSHSFITAMSLRATGMISGGGSGDEGKAGVVVGVGLGCHTFELWRWGN